MVVKKGMSMPQSLETRAIKHVKVLEKRYIISKSDSQWRNPVRFLEKPNDRIRLVVNDGIKRLS